IHSSGFSLFVMTEFYTCSGNDVNAATSRRCRKTFVLRQAVSRRCAMSFSEDDCTNQRDMKPAVHTAPDSPI
ncbi:hypothetical protein QVM52_31515, partial [Pseudomonas mosselii]|uniref:hypothetical protein n=1 Tax=Pseudomonas mosselii TaxID=78327 RepID=UPI00352A3894